MKKKYLIIPCFCAVFFITIFMLLGAAENPETKEVGRLLEKRTEIIEDMLFGNITYDEGGRQLREVEEGNLYRRDLENVKAYEDTDFEVVDKMDIVELEKEGQIYDVMNFKGKIKWTCSGYDGRYSTIERYRIGVSYKDGEYRLTTLEIQ